MSRKLSDLHPATKLRIKAVMAAMREYGYPMFVVRTYDTLDKQSKLYQQGRNKPGEKVTWITKGWHNLRYNGVPCARAVDLAFRKQPLFPDRNEWDLSWPWDRLKKIAKACDLTRTLAKDKGHLVDKQGESFSTAWQKSDQN